MRAVIFLLLLCLGVAARAREWKSELFHCAANIPDSAGWQIVEAPQEPGIAVLLAMRNPARQAVFGVNIVEGLRDANPAVPAIRQQIEALLRQFGYQFVGHSSVKAAGFDWLQYPVQTGAGAQQFTGIIRFTPAGGYVFSITMLRGGGQQAAQDVEMQQAAASFRMLPVVAPTPVAVPAMARDSVAKAPPPAPAAPVASTAGEKPVAAAEEPASGDDSRNRMIWYGAGGAIVLLIFFSIIGGGEAKKR
jgi:hypothetical protein